MKWFLLLLFSVTAYGQISLQWDNPDLSKPQNTDIDHYRVYQHSTADTTALDSALTWIYIGQSAYRPGAAFQSFNVEYLPPLTFHAWIIQAVDYHGNPSRYSESTPFYGGQAPDAPQGTRWDFHLLFPDTVVYIRKR